MSVDQNGETCGGIKIFESFHDHIPSLPFVCGEHFLRPHRPGDRYFSVKIVGMGGAEAGIASSGLGKGHGVAGMRVDYGTDIFESLKQTPMSGASEEGLSVPSTTCPSISMITISFSDRCA